MEKIRTTSIRLQKLVLVLGALSPILVLLMALAGDWRQLLYIPADITLDTARISGFGFLAMLALASIKPAAYLTALYFLYKLLGLYREGVIFAAASVSAIRKIGWALVGVDIAGMGQKILTGPVLTAFKVSSGYISVGLEVGMLTVGLFIVLIAHVMDMGRELKEQDALVI